MNAAAAADLLPEGASDADGLGLAESTPKSRVAALTNVPSSPFLDPGTLSPASAVDDAESH